MARRKRPITMSRTALRAGVVLRPQEKGDLAMLGYLVSLLTGASGRVRTPSWTSFQGIREQRLLVTIKRMAPPNPKRLT
jgi:hypothetical protein